MSILKWVWTKPRVCSLCQYSVRLKTAQLMNWYRNNVSACNLFITQASSINRLANGKSPPDDLSHVMCRIHMLYKFIHRHIMGLWSHNIYWYVYLCTFCNINIWFMFVCVIYTEAKEYLHFLCMYVLCYRSIRSQVAIIWNFIFAYVFNTFVVRRTYTVYCVWYTNLNLIYDKIVCLGKCETYW